MKNLRSRYTANFKRDYVVAVAVIIFFLIVISELVLAVSLPLYMKRENVMAVSVQRLKLREHFDGIRAHAKKVKVKNSTAQAEIDLIIWNLDRLADYMRHYIQYLSSDDLAILQQQLFEMHAYVGSLKSGVPFSREYKIDYTPYLERIMKQSGVTK